MIAIAQKPLYQAILFIVLTSIVFLIVRPKQVETIWTLAGLAYVLFILTNAAFLFWQMSPWSYLLYSLLISVAYLFIVEKICIVFTNLFDARGSGESSMIFLVIIYHPIALLMAMLVKWLYIKFF